MVKERQIARDSKGKFRASASSTRRRRLSEVEKGLRSYPLLGLTAAFGFGWLVASLVVRRVRQPARRDGAARGTEWRQGYGVGAESAVTGGLPEDINGMPVTDDFELEGPVYDGSDLDMGARRRPAILRIA